MTTTEAVESLLVQEHANGVVVLTINRPAARNAVDLSTAEAISRTLDSLDDDPDCRVIVITGAGGFFSAGMDLKAFRAKGERPIDAKRGPFGLVHMPPETPLIAAVEGAAVGGGFEIALSCDLIVAAEDAVFGLPEVKRGLTAAGGGLLRLPSSIPYHLAMEAALTGRSLTPAWCAEKGLVNRIASSGHALDAALALAEEIGANGPLAVQASKKVIVESGNWTTTEAFDRQEEIVDPVRRSSDAQEGAAAFAEKRAPVWTGR
ncbi:crotonase/enoyl-CoA hydratase family protein [Rhodococcus artemisiae]|uniref:Crotonase/enoyl-CoA hydratase family protein n=1 Tax=Rhodococcus artemisiae TaxID=714159 RepID=A0ABU7LB53_9NOCA|nr:crotonase/enoyl-CoA hydratase family protein [Rhodococcus artemisiae]MEE2058137.1 crotonase/enoyl-CoA hydratase family protein [Rhodococcus artemisiae]